MLPDRSGWRSRKRGVKAALVVGLVAAGLTMVVAAGAVAARLDLIHTHFNLSQNTSRVSAYPDVAVRSDGERVVAVWMEGYKDIAGYYKGHVYMRVASQAGESWGSRTLVFSGGDQACAYDASVEISGAMAHIAYVVFVDTCEDPSQMEVRYTTCPLDGGSCAGEEMVASVDTAFNKISWVDLALDDAADPHVVWARYDASGENGAVYYRAYDGTGSTWGAEEAVRVSGDNNTPTIAWADGAAHVVWEEEGNHQVWYRRRGSSGWEGAEALSNVQTIYTSKNPVVAAKSGRVFVVWDQCSDPDHSLDPEDPVPCSQYHLMYRQWDGSWGDKREVGTGRSWEQWDQLVNYESTSNLDQRGEYLAYLRPSVRLNQDAWPSVVWHAYHVESGGGEGGGGVESHLVYYSYAVTGTVSGAPDWITTTLLVAEQPSWTGAAAVGVGGQSDEQRLHAVYMGKPSRSSLDAWDVHYESFSHNPVAHIQGDGVVLVDSTVALDGSGSYDPQGYPLTYQWSLVEKPAGSTAALSDASAESITITVDQLGRYRVRLEVENGLASSSLETHTIVACEEVFNIYLPFVLRSTP